MLRLYNSLSRKKQAFVPISRKEVKIYTCGPTVYARPHIGNYRTYVFEDAVKRYLIYRGMRVRHVMNITDIDESVRKATKKAGVSRPALARKYEVLFRQDAASLGMLPADSYPHVSRYVQRMAGTAAKLLESGMAYKDEKCRVFFDISKFPSYGKLAGRKITGGRKVMREEYRPFQAGDFLLMSRCREKNCEKCYETRMGKCSPAWNVQCATMATAELGCRIDISMGGRDNLFNHHENTRAIANSLCGAEYSEYYLHARHLIVDGQKMSKSRKNTIYLPDLLSRGMPARASRMLLLSVHYRRRLDFTWKLAQEVKMRWLGMKKAVNRLKSAHGQEAREGFGEYAAAAKKEFEAALDDDMDVPGALDVSEKFARECADAGLSARQSRAALALLKKFDAVLGCLPV
ncbi:MAG: hypothetical protein WC717_06605 [Candidatus Micrarchaeia archaeon]